jgi:hypothetical protein
MDHKSHDHSIHMCAVTSSSSVVNQIFEVPILYLIFPFLGVLPISTSMLQEEKKVDNAWGTYHGECHRTRKLDWWCRRGYHVYKISNFSKIWLEVGIIFMIYQCSWITKEFTNQGEMIKINVCLIGIVLKTSTSQFVVHETAPKI